ncbi:hypothetical protein [Yoonia sp. 2307UL14-13]|uniref:hypothetical protein n=1 Tax=Yoonia sp. 2307UL14-13 TaxID=3126506 RepID=UPI0030ADA954
MPRKFTKFLIIPAAATLAACSGGGGGGEKAPVIAGATQATVVGANPLGLEASFDADTQVITINGRDYDDFSIDTNGRLTARRAEDIPGESRGDFNDLAIHGDTSSGSGEVFLVSSTLEEFVSDDEFEPFFVQLTRDGETTVPTSGNVEYTGAYLGSRFVESTSDDVVFFQSARIFGDVSLTADFDDTSTISGVITNRTGGGENAWQDMTLDLAAIENGGFAGTISGGGRIGESTSDGAYAGLLTGPDGGEVIGGLSILHEAGDTEAGIFVAE